MAVDRCHRLPMHRVQAGATVTGFSKKVRDLVRDRANGRCEQCAQRPGAQYHHRRPRGMGGSKDPDTNLAANCVFVCDQCHRLMESYRFEYGQRGWLVAQGKKPCETPLWRQGQWVLLDDLGYVTPTDGVA